MGSIKERLVLGVFFLASTLSNLKAQSLEDLERGLEIARDLLDRTENGRFPCFSETCTNQKKSLLHHIYREAQVLSFIDPALEDAVDEGIFSGRRMTRSDFSFPIDQNKENLSLREWFAFYERRYIDDLDSEAQWLRFSNHIESLRFTMAKYTALFRRLSDEDKEFFQEMWDRDYADILGKYREAQLVSEKRDRARREKRNLDAEKYSQRILELHQEARELSRKLGTSTNAIQDRIFPDLDNVLVTNFCLSLQIWMEFAGVDQVFDHNLLYWMQRVDDALLKLQRLTRDFNDLEYGSVGLANYFSLSNPAIRTAHEHQIQLQLEEHLSKARFIVNTGQSTFAMVVSAQLGGSSRLLQFGLLGLSNYLQDVMEFKVSQRILPPSSRVSRLEERYAYWEPRMLKRKEELERTKKIVQSKIHELENRIHKIKTEGKSNEEISTP